MSDTMRQRVLDAALDYSHIPYRLDPPPDGVNSIDCSLLMLLAAKDAGIPLPAGVRTAEQIRQATIPVDWNDVKPGDLLFFENTYDAAGPAGPDGKIASHVGLSLGAGTRRMIDAHERDGLDVAPTDISSQYWQSKLIEARRLPGLVNVDDDDPRIASPEGIDVSSHQGIVNWPLVEHDGYLFAFTKATGGAWYINPTLARNWQEIRQAGMQRGAYHYAFESSGQPFPGPGPEAEADFFLSKVMPLGLEPGDMLVLDIEEGQGNLGQWVLRWCQRVEYVVGFKPLIYTGTWFSDPHGFPSVPQLADYPLWLAAYQSQMPPPPKPWTKVSFWQYTSSGTVTGVRGDCDVNLFNGNSDQLVLYGKPEDTQIPEPEFAVGDGLRNLMKQHQDTPASDELYFKHGTRDAWSEAFGKSGARYVWLPSAGKGYRFVNV